MTVFLVIAMVVVIAAAQWLLLRQRRREADRARSAVRFVEVGPTAKPAPDVLFHPGHTWVQMHEDGLASVGATAFAAHFAGEIERVELPAEGRRYHKAERACTLVSKSGRRLELGMPVDGRVLAVNRDVLRDPALIQHRPYDQGWIVRVKPQRALVPQNLLPLSAAQAWFDSARAAVTARLAKVSTVSAFDGGEWVPGFGERIEDKDWFELRRELFPEPTEPHLNE